MTGKEALRTMRMRRFNRIASQRAVVIPERLYMKDGKPIVPRWYHKLYRKLYLKIKGDVFR